MNELRESPFGGSSAASAFRQARLVLAAAAVCDELHEITDYVAFEAHITDLKFLAALLPKQSDKLSCLNEVLRLRKMQLRAECRPPAFQFSDAGCYLRPQVPATPPASPTADAFPGSSVGAVGNLSR